jgi:hypothetical protein
MAAGAASLGSALEEELHLLKRKMMLMPRAIAAGKDVDRFFMINKVEWLVNKWII